MFPHLALVTDCTTQTHYAHRLEVLRSCAVAVLVLTQSYAKSKAFPKERDMALARLVAAQRQKGGKLVRQK